MSTMAKRVVNPREKFWKGYAVTRLVGRTITEVRYLTPDEARDIGWTQRPLVMFLDDGTYILPMSDDEGNAAGALTGQKGDDEMKFPVLPVEW